MENASIGWATGSFIWSDCMAIRQLTGFRCWPDTVHFIMFATSLQKAPLFYSSIFDQSTNSRKEYTNNKRLLMRNKTFAILNALRTHVPHNIIIQKLYRSVSQVPWQCSRRRQARIKLMYRILKSTVPWSVGLAGSRAVTRRCSSGGVADGLMWV